MRLDESRRPSAPWASLFRPVLVAGALLLAFCCQPAAALPPAAAPAAATVQETSPPAGQPAAAPAVRPGINLFRLLQQGGWFMLPLLAISLFAAGIAVERWIALQRDRLMPERMIQRLARLGQQPGGLDPRDAWLVCQGTPSIAADVLRSVLVKVGRPHMELEHACSESAQRAAIRLQQPVSWLNLCAALAPLIGLLGTVWGITQAFYDMTQLEIGQNRADALARGIYVALVTTIAGLTIAIPCTMAAHWFENRIVTLMNRIEEMIRGLLPQLERYEGVVRFTQPGPDDAPAAPVSGNGRAPGDPPRDPGPSAYPANGPGSSVVPGIGGVPDPPRSRQPVRRDPAT